MRGPKADKFEQQIAAAQEDGDVGSLGQWLREERARNARLSALCDSAQDRCDRMIEHANRAQEREKVVRQRAEQAEELLREASSACEPIASRLSERIDSFRSEQGPAAPQRGE